MKLAISLCFFAVVFTAITVSEAGNSRQKRALGREYCPTDASHEECEEYARSVSKTLRYCHTFDVNNGLISWASCGTVSCGDGFRLVEEDLSRPYPECCKYCEEV